METIKFQCKACLEEKEAKDQSEELGFCKGCYALLTEDNYFTEKIKNKEKNVKKVEAETLVKTLGPGYELENKDGHYAVKETATGKRVKTAKTPVLVEVYRAPQVVEPEKTETIIPTGETVTLKGLCQILGVEYNKFPTKPLLEVFPDHHQKNHWAFTQEMVEKVQEYLTQK